MIEEFKDLQLEKERQKALSLMDEDREKIAELRAELFELCSLPEGHQLQNWQDITEEIYQKYIAEREAKWYTIKKHHPEAYQKFNTCPKINSLIDREEAILDLQKQYIEITTNIRERLKGIYALHDVKNENNQNSSSDRSYAKDKQKNAEQIQEYAAGEEEWQQQFSILYALNSQAGELNWQLKHCLILRNKFIMQRIDEEIALAEQNAATPNSNLSDAALPDAQLPAYEPPTTYEQACAAPNPANLTNPSVENLQQEISGLKV